MVVDCSTNDEEGDGREIEESEATKLGLWGVLLMVKGDFEAGVDAQSW